MKRLYSGHKLLIRLFVIMLLVNTLCLGICGAYSIYSNMQELVYCNDAAMDVYLSGMEHTMDDLSDFCDEIYNEGSSFRMLALGRNRISETEYLRATQMMQRMVDSRISAYTGILFFHVNQSENYYRFGSKFDQITLAPDIMAFMREVRNIWACQQNPEQLGWITMTTKSLGGASLMMKARRYKDMYLCVMINLSAYNMLAEQEVAGSSPMVFSFLSEKEILTNTEYAESAGIDLDSMLQISGQNTYTRKGKYIYQTRFEDGADLGVCSIISMQSIWGNLRVVTILLLIGLAVGLAVFIWMYRIAKKTLMLPMETIRETSMQIAAGELKVVRGSERMQEIVAIEDALETLVTQKIDLETERSRQKKEKEHAMLQYYQLQTRSHFLLNCMKSLYNLAAQGEIDRMMQVITRFSNHIRYVFHDSLTFVTVEEELNEVEDYFDIINPEQQSHILLAKSVDPELMQFKVPPLIIQTFVENFHKHNKQQGKILKFSIRIDRVELEEGQFVRIRMSDNGSGYSEEALTQLGEMGGTFAQFHVGIQNLCRRIDILYQGKHQTAFFNQPSGGACSVFYLPLESEEVSIGDET